MLGFEGPVSMLGLICNLGENVGGYKRLKLHMNIPEDLGSLRSLHSGARVCNHPLVCSYLELKPGSADSG